MLQVIYIGVYDFIDPDATLYFVTTLIPRKFDIFPYILNEHFIVTTPIGEIVVAKRVYRNCPIILPSKDTYVELVELDIVNCDIILRIVFVPFILEL